MPPSEMLHGDGCLRGPSTGRSKLLSRVSANIITRHNRQKRLLAEYLTRAAREPRVEPKSSELEHTRSEIRAIRAAGGDDIFDVTIFTPLLAQQLKRALSQTTAHWFHLPATRKSWSTPLARPKNRRQSCSHDLFGIWRMGTPLPRIRKITST